MKGDTVQKRTLGNSQLEVSRHPEELEKRTGL